MAILARADGGVPRESLCAEYGISVQTFYRWRRRYGDRVQSPVRKLREAEEENARLRKLLIEKELENHRLQDVIQKYRSH